MTPQHGPSWDEDRAWSAFAPDPEPRHLAERPRPEVRHPLALVLALVASAVLLAPGIVLLVRVVAE